MKNKFLSGFTLSEALIAVGIVGVIAVLTIPNLVKNYQRKTFALAIKKNYTVIQESLALLQSENYRNKTIYGTILYGDYRKLDENVGEFLTQYFKVSKDCGKTPQPCFAQKYGTINGGREADFGCGGYSVALSNGAAICMRPASISQIYRIGQPVITVKNPVTVYIDTNGPSAPNIGGRDMFTFNIYEDFSIDEVTPDQIKIAKAEDDRNERFVDYCLTSNEGAGCFGKLINDNWEMNY